MISKIEKQKIRKVIFNHLDGFSISAIINSFNKNKLTSFLRTNKTFDTNMLQKKFSFNVGYMNVALRLLSSQGLINQKIISDGKNISYHITKKGLHFFNYFDEYNFCIDYFLECDNNKLMFHKNINSKHYLLLEELLKLSKLHWRLDKNKKYNKEIISHLNGILISPIITSLAYNNLLNQNKLNYIVKTYDKFKIILKILSIEGWIDNEYNITKQGKYAFKIASAYGVTVSYLPTFIKTNELIFGNSEILKINTNIKKEIHVNRPLNVWASGGSHKTYFKYIDLIVLKIFNKPIEKQPIGIADMGCGDGTFILHLNELIKKTKRYKYIKEFPLKFIGADYNNEALKETDKNLKENFIDYTLIKADISNPNHFNKKVKELLNLNLNDFLNVRTFLDHNRVFSEPKNNFTNISESSCCFSSKGRWISNSMLESNLIEHFLKWKPYISKHGLILLELHSIEPKLCSMLIGRSLSIPYDATHGFSDQYILELDRFIECVKKSGLKIDFENSFKFPNNESATISINYINQR
jgi:hypothetical protein